jgi:hypothetical protein
VDAGHRGISPKNRTAHRQARHPAKPRVIF